MIDFCWDFVSLVLVLLALCISHKDHKYLMLKAKILVIRTVW